MSKKLISTIALSMLLCGSMATQAAFVVKKSHTIERTTGTPSRTDNAVTSSDYKPADESKAAAQPDRSKQTRTAKKGNGLAAFILGMLGIGAVVGAIMVLPASLLGFILLGVLASLLGFSAIGCAEIDKKSIAPAPALAHIGLALGIIESLPLLIPVFLIYLVYYLCGGGRQSKGFK